MKITSLVFLLIFISTTFINAQNEESYKLYKMESIYLKGTKYVKNDVSYPMGFLNTNLAQEMEISEHAIIEWNKFVTARNWSMITAIAGLGLTVAAFGAERNNLRRDLAIAGLTATIISLPISIKAGNQLQKSIWTRNRDLFK